jgi:hypothetical protein
MWDTSLVEWITCRRSVLDKRWIKTLAPRSTCTKNFLAMATTRRIEKSMGNIVEYQTGLVPKKLCPKTVSNKGCALGESNFCAHGGEDTAGWEIGAKSEGKIMEIFFDVLNS